VRGVGTHGGACPVMLTGVGVMVTTANQTEQLTPAFDRASFQDASLS
jgi:hypothetical protein